MRRKFKRASWSDMGSPIRHSIFNIRYSIFIVVNFKNPLSWNQKTPSPASIYLKSSASSVSSSGLSPSGSTSKSASPKSTSASPTSNPKSEPERSGAKSEIRNPKSEINASGYYGSPGEKSALLPPKTSTFTGFFQNILPFLYCFLITSLLLPYCFLIASLLLPYYFPIASLLLPYYFLITSLLLPYCFPITSLLHMPTIVAHLPPSPWGEGAGG